MSGGHLFEASLILKLMIERKYKIQNVIIETDLNLSNEKTEGIASVLPYIHSSKLIETF
jgi:UDP-N-acetylglucosamine:LPS N-acetylglucosamine transferase